MRELHRDKAVRCRDLYDRAAKERQKDAGKHHGRGKVPENLPDANSTDARDAAGKAVGVTGRTVDYATRHPPGSPGGVEKSSNKALSEEFSGER